MCSVCPRFLNMVICEYCTRDAREKDPKCDPVWVEIRPRESVVLRKLPKPRVRKNDNENQAILFKVEETKYMPGYSDPFDQNHLKSSDGADSNSVPY